MKKTLSALLVATLIGLISVMAADADTTEEQIAIAADATLEGQMAVGTEVSEQGRVHGLSTACAADDGAPAAMNPNCFGE
ncbi:MAG TPA: hypothetical protein VG370_18925 [Chloroflexota bacterium]|jgi:hypothetical protein|nr:hypothetical protein [Chloroflexota bacterium]